MVVHFVNLAIQTYMYNVPILSYVIPLDTIWPACADRLISLTQFDVPSVWSLRIYYIGVLSVL